MKYLGIISFILWLVPVAVRAHPLDITFSDVLIPESGLVQIHTSIHPYEVSVLLETQGINVTSSDEFYAHQDEIVGYLTSHTSLHIGGRCDYQSFNLPIMDEFDMLADGVHVEATLRCPSLAGTVTYVSALFTEDFPLQTNHVDFYRNQNVIYHKVLTKDLTQLSFSLNNPGAPLPDADHDGIGDSDEQKYGTDLQKADSDGDGYTDKEEIENSWNPTSTVLSPGQQPRPASQEASPVLSTPNTSRPDSDIAAITDVSTSASALASPTAVGSGPTSSASVASASPEVPITNNPSATVSPQPSLQTGLGRGYLNQIIKLLSEPGWPGKLLLMILAFALGIIHSLEVGQGKSILATYLLERRARFSDAVRFSSFMTATHVIDIVVITTLLSIFSFFTDIYRYSQIIEYLGVWALLLAAVYLFIRSIYAYRHPHHHDHDNDYRKQGIWLGLIAGLAPCALGWTMLAAAISLGQISWLFPLIAAFAAGIFVSLLIISAVVLVTKEQILNRFQRLVAIAPIVSASLLLMVALVAAWRLFGANY